MKKTILSVIVVFMIIGMFGGVFASDRVPQRIELDIKTNVNFPLVYAVYQNVLSRATNLQKLVLVSADSNEQKQLGIKGFHGKVLLGASESNKSWSLDLFSVGSHATNRFGVVQAGRDSTWVSSVDTLSKSVLQRIENEFPPKPKEVLSKIEVKVRKVSVFEPTKPEFKVRLFPIIGAYFKLEQKAWVSNTSTNSNNGPYDMNVKQDVLFWSGEIGAEWHYLNWLVFANFAYLQKGNVEVLGGMMGLFDSLVLLGPVVARIESHFDMDKEWSFTDNGTNFTHAAPNLSYTGYYVGPAIQVNLRPGYYLRVVGGFDLGGEINSTMGTKSITNVLSRIHWDRHFTALELNIQIVEHWNVVLKYSMSGQNMYLDKADTTINDIIDQKSGFDWYLQDTRANMIYYGLGVEYVF